MSTFLFAAGVRDRPLDAWLRSAASLVEELMPSPGAPLAASFVSVPEVQGGWVWLAPRAEQLPALLSAAEQAHRTALVFGDLAGARGESAASLLLRVWQTGGLDAVRGLDGSFGAVLIDRGTHEIWLLCDLVGHRYLRYLADGETLLVSPHDLPLVATGRCRTDMDLTSACSIVTWGWSVSGRSLLRDLHTIRPTRVVRWSRGQLTERLQPFLTVARRIQPGQAPAHLERMIEVMRQNARAFVAQDGPIDIFLTAGIDTRAILSLLRSVASGSRIRALTYGGPRDLEVRVARRLARWAGCQFTSEVRPPGTDAEILQHCDVRAFYLNGDTSSKRALSAVPLPGSQAALRRVSGGTGEVYRGYYYQGTPRWGSGVDAEGAVHVLLRRYRYRHLALPWLEPDHVLQRLSERLRQTIAEYAAISPNGYDLLDLFYLHDRVGVWGALATRLPWQTQEWNPFRRPELIQLAFQMPAPVGRYCRLHEALIRRYLPSGYYLARINGRKWLPLEGGGGVRRWLRRLDQRGLGVVEALRRRLIRGRHTPFQRDAFAGPLAPLVREIVDVEGGFGRQLLGAQGLGRVLEEHRDQRHNHLEALGSLVTMERWRSMVEQAARRAATAHV
jgi:hypothetical protein